MIRPVVISKYIVLLKKKITSWRVGVKITPSKRCVNKNTLQNLNKKEELAAALGIGNATTLLKNQKDIKAKVKGAWTKLLLLTVRCYFKGVGMVGV